MGIVGQQQGVAFHQPGNIGADPGLGNPLFRQVLGGNAGELLNHWRHHTAWPQGDQLIVFLHHHRLTIPLLHHHSGKLNDLIPGKQQTGCFRIKQHQPVIFGK